MFFPETVIPKTPFLHNVSAPNYVMIFSIFLKVMTMKNFPNVRLISILLIILAALLFGCQNSSDLIPADQPVESGDSSAPESPAVVSGRTGSFFAINEIVLGPEGYIALTNFTDVPVSTGGLILCQGADCFELPDEEVPAGETVKVAVSDGSGLEDVIATQASIGELRSADGEIAIFASPDYNDPKALLVYLQWGSTPHELTTLALEAGLWFETSYAPSGPNATRLYRVEESGLWLWE